MEAAPPTHEHQDHKSPPGPDRLAAGSHPAPPTPMAHGDGKHGGHDRRAGHSVAMFRDRFGITLLLTVPTLVWSDIIQGWLGFRAPEFPGSAHMPAIFGAAVYLYGGWVFLAGGVRELRDRLPGMMTLISLSP
jgi:P-type Cu2+ transporter